MKLATLAPMLPLLTTLACANVSKDTEGSNDPASLQPAEPADVEGAPEAMDPEPAPMNELDAEPVEAETMNAEPAKPANLDPEPAEADAMDPTPAEPM